jgi:hypothetical protein
MMSPAGFRPEQFIVLTTSELKNDQINALHRIATFMDRPFSLKQESKVEQGYQAYKRRHPDFSPETVTQLQDFFRPHNQALVKILLENRFNTNPGYILKEFARY